MYKKLMVVATNQAVAFIQPSLMDWHVVPYNFPLGENTYDLIIIGPAPDNEADAFWLLNILPTKLKPMGLLVKAFE